MSCTSAALSFPTCSPGTATRPSTRYSVDPNITALADKLGVVGPREPKIYRWARNQPLAPQVYGTLGAPAVAQMGDGDSDR